MKSNRFATPWASGLLVLAVISLGEYAVMLLLPLVLPPDAPRIVESLVDSALLALVASPVLWWAIVCPLQRAAALRGRYLANLFSAIEDERRRVAHELHDDVGQSLTLLISGLRSLGDGAPLSDERRRSLEGLAENALASVKQLALGLRPSLLDDLGLTPAMERLAGELAKHHPLEVKLDVASLAGKRLPATVETALFRIYQEALNNVLKHSQARQAVVKLRRDSKEVWLEVADDGRGIELAELYGKLFDGGHMGFTGMRERVGQLGGTLTIDSKPGHGMKLRVHIPLEPARQ